MPACWLIWHATRPSLELLVHASWSLVDALREIVEPLPQDLSFDQRQVRGAKLVQQMPQGLDDPIPIVVDTHG